MVVLSKLHIQLYQPTYLKCFSEKWMFVDLERTIQDFTKHLQLSLETDNALKVFLNNVELEKFSLLSQYNIHEGDSLKVKMYRRQTPATYRVMVKTVSGKVKTFYVHSTVTFKNIQHMLQDYTGVPAENIELHFNQKPVDERQSPLKYFIRRTGVLMMHIRKENPIGHAQLHHKVTPNQGLLTPLDEQAQVSRVNCKITDGLHVQVKQETPVGYSQLHNAGCSQLHNAGYSQLHNAGYSQLHNASYSQLHSTTKVTPNLEFSATSDRQPTQITQVRSTQSESADTQQEYSPSESNRHDVNCNDSQFKNCHQITDTQCAGIKECKTSISTSIEQNMTAASTPLGSLFRRLTMNDFHSVMKEMKDLYRGELLFIGGALGLLYPWMIRHPHDELPLFIVEAWINEDFNVRCTPCWEVLAKAFEELNKFGKARQIRENYGSS